MLHDELPDITPKNLDTLIEEWQYQCIKKNAEMSMHIENRPLWIALQNTLTDLPKAKVECLNGAYFMYELLRREYNEIGLPIPQLSCLEVELHRQAFSYNREMQEYYFKKMFNLMKTATLRMPITVFFINGLSATYSSFDYRPKTGNDFLVLEA